MPHGGHRAPRRPALTAADRPAGLQGIVRFVYNDLNAAAAAVKYAQSIRA